MHVLAKLGLGLIGGAAVVAGGSYGIVKIEERRQHKKLVKELIASPTLAQVAPALGIHGAATQRAFGVGAADQAAQQS